MCVLGGGGGVHGTKVSKKTPQNNLLKINIHRIVHSYFKFNIHKYCNVIKCGGECICFGNHSKNNFLLILCIFNYNHYGKIFMFSAFNSALTTVHQGNPKYLYTQGVSLFLRHNLKSRASSIIN